MIIESAAADLRPLRPRGSPALRRALVTLAATCCVTAGLETALVVASYPDLARLLGGFVLVGLMTVLVGVWAWDRRPANRSGLLIVCLGLADMLAAAGNIDNDVLIWAGSIAGEAPVPALLHLVLAFPTGRLGGRMQRAVVVAGYLLCVGLHSVRLLFTPGDPLSTSGPFADPQIAQALRTLQSGLIAVVLLVAACVLIGRVRAHRDDRRERTILSAVYLYGALAILSFPLSANLNRWLLHLDPVGLFSLQIVVVASVPIVFAAAVLGGGFARTWGIEELAAWLAAPGARRPPVQLALATALGDPGLQVLFPIASDVELRPRYMDAAGRPVDLPDPGTGRSVTLVGDPAAPQAAIVHDTAVTGGDGLVRAAARVLELALQRERLDVELHAGRERLRAASARIVGAADAERRRIGQDLHDQVQSHLVMAAVHAGAHNQAGLQAELDAAMARLREVVHGIAPAILVERGLFAAVDELADRLPLRCEVHLLPGAVPLPDALAGTAYGIVQEALTNVVKHAAATSVTLRVEQRADVLLLEVRDDGCGLGVPLTPDAAPPGPGGTGLNGIADRVEALAGRLRITSAPGAGTRLWVELPCGS